MMKTKTKGVMERPLTMKSGTALQSHYSVQHRSDILMDEQTEAVRKAQEDLKKALSNLETAKGEDTVDQYRTAVQEAKEKSEKAIMVLQVLTKVNTELAFARAELDEALEKQEGDINEARKRVMWLEDRMGLMCGKARLRGQGYQKPKSKTFHRSPDRSVFRSRLGSASDSEKSSDDEDYSRGGGQRMGRNLSIGFKSDTTRARDAFTPSESGSEYQGYPQQRGMGMADTPSSGAESLQKMQAMGLKGRGLDASDSDSDDGMPSMMDLPPGLQGMTGAPSYGSTLKPALKKQDSYSGSEVDSQGQASPAVPQTYQESEVTHSVRYEDEEQTETGEQRSGSPEREEDESSDRDEPQPADQPAQEQPEADAQQEEEVDEETEEGEKEGQGQVADEDGQVENEEKVEGEKTVDREKSDVSESGQSYLTESSQTQPEKEKLLDREVSVAKSVTIKVPKRVDVDADPMAQMVIQQDTEDLASNYWYSEHHRFEYSQYSDALCEIDPLSYHSVGLAVPGSFIDKPERSFETLPWRVKRKGSEINDIHKIALDKLAGRVHTMYDKLYDAAMLSVRSKEALEGRRETTMMSFDNREGARSTTPTDSRPGMITAPPTTADTASRPQTVAIQPAVIDLPLKIRPGLNVYHPKPIPPPQMLPLTRISKDKTYPRLMDSFFDQDDILAHKPAVRIVDQRNLYNETKLKLYRDRPKNVDTGPSSMEKKFRMMLEQEKTMTSKSSRSSRQTTPGSSRSSSAKPRDETSTISSLVSKSVSVMGKGPGTRMSMSRTLTKASTWSKIKPSSRGKEYGGLKWERVKTLVHVSLVSRRIDERRDAAKHLGLLRCGDAMVFYALKERLRVDDDTRVKYEAAKSLILLGCWDEDVVQVVLKYLVLGNTEVRQDLIRNMIDGKNIQYANKKTPSFPELVKVLSHFCRNPDLDDPNAFDAAVLLGKLCVADENAKFKLLRTLEHSSDTHVKAKALEVLVKQLNCTSWEVVQHILSLFKESPVWKYRAMAADLLIILGKEHVCKKGEEERIYLLLERKLWDDPTRDVKIASAKTLAALGMFSKACDRIEKRLEDTDEDTRAQAVISVGTLEMKSEKIIRLLLEMLELDASEYVRLMIARTFATLQLTDKRVLRALRERDKVEGALSREHDLDPCRTRTPTPSMCGAPYHMYSQPHPPAESRKALKVLESLATQARLTSPTGRRSMGSHGTPRGITPRYTPAVTA